MMKKNIIILLLTIVPIIGLCNDDLNINSRYSSTITEPFSTNLYGERIGQQTMMMSLPVDPGEPIPDPMQTPINDLPFVFLLIISVTYSIYRIKKTVRN